jgi:hypothetical protein
MKCIDPPLNEKKMKAKKGRKIFCSESSDLNRNGRIGSNFLLSKLKNPEK